MQRSKQGRCYKSNVIIAGTMEEVYVLLVGEDMLSASFLSVSKDISKLIRIIQQTYEQTEGLGPIIETEESIVTQYTYYSQELERNRSFLISKEHLL